MKVEYVVLEHCPEINATTGRAIVVVTKVIESAHEHSLAVYTARDWSKNVDPRDAKYVRTVIEDLQELSPDERDAIFLRMTEMSSGPLRTGDQGVCDNNDLAAATGIDLEI